MNKKKKKKKENKADIKNFFFFREHLLVCQAPSPFAPLVPVSLPLNHLDTSLEQQLLIYQSPLHQLLHYLMIVMIQNFSMSQTRMMKYLVSINNEKMSECLFVFFFFFPLRYNIKCAITVFLLVFLFHVLQQSLHFFFSFLIQCKLATCIFFYVVEELHK